ncbi:hypothetical protein GIB67_041579 [Kingdonia uniflora]|uniref:Mechanosensitive ion channel protein n=1 Tax=Kingdonia uniflora TaxID=39325 RepID=A0A7J7MQW7_9MAGN|nr:hypothetical protein GIB67_041579 [Kingdonia uniflora]
MESSEGKDDRETDNGADVVLVIPDDKEGDVDGSNIDVSNTITSNITSMGMEAFRLQDIQRNSFANFPSPGISSRSPGFSPGVRLSPNKPPKIPTQNLTRRTSYTSPALPVPKPKSRFIEPSVPPVANPVEEKVRNLNSPYRNPSSPFRTSPSNIKVSANSPSRETSRIPSLVTPKTPLIESPAVDEDEEDEEIYKSEKISKTKKNSGKKMKILIIVELIAFICIMGWLVTSLTINRMQDLKLWSLVMWKWCVLVLVIFCGRLFSMWFISVLVFLIERNFLLRKKVLYFVYGLKKSVQAFIWLGLVLLAWALLIDRGVERSKEAADNLNYVTRALISLLVGAVIVLLKTLFLKLLASSFHVSTFFDRIQESIFHQYVLQTLSGPPSMELAEKIGAAASTAQLSFRSAKKGKEEQEVVDISKLHRLKPGKVSAWTMKGLINVINTSGLSTLSHTIEEIDDEEGEQKDKEITTEWEAKAAAYRIFKNVAKPGSKYIEEEDLLRFLSKEEMVIVLPLFAGAAETGKIKKSALRTWVVIYLAISSIF